jgi:transcriptional regulator with XRE-family HTH domain
MPYAGGTQSEAVRAGVIDPEETAMKTMLSLGPRDAAEAQIFAVERFRVDIQHHIQTLMNRRGMTQKQLAEKLGISEARVSQFFSHDCNLTLKGLARIFHALDAECSIASRDVREPPSSGRGDVTPPPRSLARLKATRAEHSRAPARSRTR